MWPDHVSNSEPLAQESDPLPTVLCCPAKSVTVNVYIDVFQNTSHTGVYLC